MLTENAKQWELKCFQQIATASAGSRYIFYRRALFSIAFLFSSFAANWSNESSNVILLGVKSDVMCLEGGTINSMPYLEYHVTLVKFRFWLNNIWMNEWMNDYNDNHVRETRIKEFLYFYLLLLFLNLLFYENVC